MTDLSHTIAPKSDQLNADDLVPGPRTITVRRVSTIKDPAQPTSIFYEGDDNKPYKPCLSMRRVLFQLWGGDGAAYVGRSMTLYRDPNVQFGPDTVGGIRISHMSHINGEQRPMITVTRGKKKPYTVKPLQTEQRAATIEDARGWIEEADSIPMLEQTWRSKAMAPFRDQLQGELDARKAALQPKPETQQQQQPKASDGFDAP